MFLHLSYKIALGFRGAFKRFIFRLICRSIWYLKLKSMLAKFGTNATMNPHGNKLLLRNENSYFSVRIKISITQIKTSQTTIYFESIDII